MDTVDAGDDTGKFQRSLQQQGVEILNNKGGFYNYLVWFSCKTGGISTGMSRNP